MGSGYFPITATEAVLSALKILEEVRGDMAGTCDTGENQYDNALLDGMYLGDFATGLKLIRECFKLSDEQKAELDKIRSDARSKASW